MAIIPAPESFKTVKGTLSNFLVFLWNHVQIIPHPTFDIARQEANFLQYARVGNTLPFSFEIEGHDNAKGIVLVVSGRIQPPEPTDYEPRAMFEIEAGVITPSTNYLPDYALRFAKLHHQVATLAVMIQNRGPSRFPFELHHALRRLHWRSEGPPVRCSGPS